MITLFILQNQHGYFLGKNKEWLDGREPNALFRSLHKDEALNMMFEVNTQDVELRISIKECEANNKKQPLLADDDLPPPLAKQEPEDQIEVDSATDTAQSELQNLSDNAISA